MARKSTTVGEPFVWLTSLGIALGLLMIFGMLGLILWEGVNVFWPRRIVTVTLTEDATSPVNGARTLAGVVVHQRVKAGRTIDEATGKLAPPQSERQLFIGNKDVYGLGFCFVNDHDIAGTSTDADLMRMERLEYGDMIGYPVSITFGGDDQTAPLAAGDPTFDATFHRLVSEASDRWDNIHDLEKGRIGRINRAMEQLKIDRRTLDRRAEEGNVVPQASYDRIDQEFADWQSQYNELAAQAASLRKLQEKDTFHYRLVTGQERSLHTGDIVDYYYPNRLSTLQRFGHFCSSMWHFVSQDPRNANTEGGIFPAIFGTFVMTVIMSLLVTPFGVMAAIYLREYAKQGALVRMVRVAINNLAGVPSIVFGVFGLGFFVYYLGGEIDKLFYADRLPDVHTFGTGGILWASLTLALLTVPVVIVAAEEAFASVPRGVREGALACGASQWQTIVKVVLPAAAPGILTGIILAMARGAGEVAPLMLVGVVKLAPELPLNFSYPFIHLDQKFMHLGFHIYDLGFQSPDSEAAKPMVFATTLILIVLVVVLNLAAIVIRERLRKKYATGAF